MIPLPREPRRDKLVQDASFLPVRKLLKNRGAAIEKRANEMEREGAKVGEIFKETGEMVDRPDVETGVWKGPENQWRFELSDENAGLTDKARDAMNDPGYDPNRGSIIGGELQTIYNHPDLFSREPLLGKTLTRMDMFDRADPMSPMGLENYYQNESTRDPHGFMKIQSWNDVPINSVIDDQSLLSLLNHETGHRTQDFFNMPQGGTAFQWDPKLRMEVPHSDLTKAWKSIGLTRTNDLIRQSQDLGRRMNWSDEFLEKHPDLLRAAGYAEALKLPKNMNRPHEVGYLQLAGENDARQSAVRMNMTGAERRADPAYRTEETGVSPYALQLLKSKAGLYRMPSRDTLARLIHGFD